MLCASDGKITPLMHGKITPLMQRSRQSSYVLGRSVHEFAPAVAALTDSEELVAPKTIYQNDEAGFC